ncbi:MAG: hypothetical protein NVS3B21_12190 [Acidimicrobiales bacterium]
MLSSALPAQATSSFTFTRLAGADRYDTAAMIATTTFTQSVSVVMATGQTYPDALAGNALAGSLGAPILLTQQGSVPSTTLSALQKLGTKNVTLLGGTVAISSAVQSQLQSSGYTVTRIAGATRYDTAQAIAQASGTPGAYGAGKTAIVASGANFPDALAAGPISYGKHFPTLLTDPSGLSSQASQALQSLGIKQVLIPGGTAAVSATAESQIQALGIATKRLAGADRTATAATIAQFAITSLSFSSTRISLARGDGFADALAGGPFGGSNLITTVLSSSPTTLGTATQQFLAANAANLATGDIFGGTGAVSNTVQNQATVACGGAPSGGGWQALTPAASPSGRMAPAMAYDSDHHQDVLFGGAANQMSLNDTWTFDGTNWTAQNPPTRPAPRTGAAMAFDAATHQTVMFGGFVDSNLPSNPGTYNTYETWTWDGATWTQHSPANYPPRRAYASMAYDPVRGVVVLFGGADANSYNDTWTWDGTNWTQQHPASAPSPRGGASMAWDSAINKIVLFGGDDVLNGYSSDTWVWDGTTWGQATITGPSYRQNAAMADDPIDAGVMLFGGSNGTDLGDTWVLGANGWSSPPNLNPTPSPRNTAAMAYDANVGGDFLFGGIAGNTTPGDTWLWTGAPSSGTPSAPPPSGPTVSSVSPTTGPSTGGTAVTVTGSGFTGATQVTFGGTSAGTPTVNSDTSLTVTSPPGSPGTVDVSVVTPNGTSARSSADSFTYTSSSTGSGGSGCTPVVNSISPTSGPASGGTVVTITGCGFTGATQVNFGGNPSPHYNVDSDTQITATSPPGTPGAVVDITVFTPSGASYTSPGTSFSPPPNQFTYQ